MTSIMNNINKKVSIMQGKWNHNEI